MVISLALGNDTMTVRSKGTIPSGRFLLRIDPGLHAALRGAAAHLGLSLNDYCARKLAAPGSFPVGSVGAIAAVQRAASLIGASLVGVVAFGSWVRGELRDGSDVDLLVVVEERVQLNRDLYRRWDAAPLSWDERHVEPHFVHLPPEGGAAVGLWTEVAMEGILLHARDLDLPRRLVGIRRTVAEGRVVRRVAHGQPYWVEVA